VQTCTGCGQTKAAEEFGYRNKATGRQHRRCKGCVGQYGRKHYAVHKAQYSASSRRNSDARRWELAKKAQGYLLAHPCVDCGQSDPLVLDFDHVDPAEKRSTIYRLIHYACSWKTIESEIRKCEVRCANCHHRRTAMQFGWAKLAFSPELRRDWRNIPPPSARRMRSSGIVRERVPQPSNVQVLVDQRLCARCGSVKILEQFHFRSAKTQIRHHVCADCFNAYRREHYRIYRDEYVRRNVHGQRQRRREWMLQLWQYVAKHPCVDCGEADPLVLHFDHRDPVSKRATLRFMSQRAFAWPTLEAEIAKCDIRCANCHRRRTAAQFNWPKLALISCEGAR
jgi:hypothetical protein